MSIVQKILATAFMLAIPALVFMGMSECTESVRRDKIYMNIAIGLFALIGITLFSCALYGFWSIN